MLEISPAQRMAAKRAATAESSLGGERQDWAVSRGALGQSPEDAALAPMAAKSPNLAYAARRTNVRLVKPNSLPESAMLQSTSLFQIEVIALWFYLSDSPHSATTDFDEWI